MRCLACNVNLSDAESTRKSATTGEYIDLCNRCYGSIADDVPTLEGNNNNGEEGEEGTSAGEAGHTDEDDGREALGWRANSGEGDL